MKKETKKRPSTACKDTKESGFRQVFGQIKSHIQEKCRQWRISPDGMTRENSVVTLTAHTTGKSAVCPCCGKCSTHVHSHRLRKIQCTELFGVRTLLILDVRHFICRNTECIRGIFSEPLPMVRRYGRNTHEAERRIQKSRLWQGTAARGMLP